MIKKSLQHLPLLLQPWHKGRKKTVKQLKCSEFPKMERERTERRGGGEGGGDDWTPQLSVSLVAIRRPAGPPEGRGLPGVFRSLEVGASPKGKFVTDKTGSRRFSGRLGCLSICPLLKG